MGFANTVREVIERSSGHAAREASSLEDANRMHTSGGNDLAEAYLKTLSDEAVMKLQTLMFVGKDKHLNISKVHENLQGLTANRHEAIRAMTSKVPLGEYLEKGLEIAAKQGMNLDADF